MQLGEKLRESRRAMSDAARPRVVEERHAAGFLTARERLEALLDPGSAVHYGAINGRAGDEWIATTGGVDVAGTVAGMPIVASSTDYTDRGGGYGGGRLTRLYALAHEHRWPIVLFADGGGSRAAYPPASERVGLGTPVGRFGLFEGMAELSASVPTIAVVSGPSYAGHASLAAFCDFLVATQGSSIGMGGPPMVEAALGLRLTHQELGAVERQEQLGGIDLLVEDEPAAIVAIRRYLSYLRDEPAGDASSNAGNIASLVLADGAYDVRPVIEALVDAASFFELKPNSATAVVTGWARLGGRTLAVVASQPASATQGAIDPAAASKLARFVEIADAYRTPVLALVDTPGFVLHDGDGRVRPGMTRQHARPLLVHQHRTVPVLSVQVRRGGGLAPFALTGYGPGRATAPLRLAWPTVDLSGVDGFAAPVADANAFDDVIDPSETREYLIRLLSRIPRPQRDGKTRRVDSC